MNRWHLTILTGASRGLGRAMAEQLLGPNRLLLTIERRPDPSLATLAARSGTHLEQWSQDLAETAEAAERLARWLETRSPATLASATLINNAAVLPPIGPLQSSPATALSQALRVGLEAPMHLTAAFLRITDGWVQSQDWDGPRRVLNISSGLGRYPMAGQSIYCAVKAGLDHFSRCTALDEARRPRGARIVSLAPGVIDTDMQAQMRAGDPAVFPDLDRFLQLHAQGQLTSPQQAAQRVLAWLERPDFGDPCVADVRNAG
ncbi:MAG: SDR family NAD(P)-dependent oxidoreductase [Tepidimonas sp.]|uniref:SDR family NAD(P)-dependent oxidoreductase n=1 Tax=Tepidimonas sp. TaxID=2002775 RepID=UPI00259D9A0C|nr:SDR family NAD(P)-dependent oxidoreductase [Tepidimonas sp.]MDM7456571.1 SDR family NAD(P)-dependent oxidoreductase [Tepidimonas sp.]